MKSILWSQPLHFLIFFSLQAQGTISPPTNVTAQGISGSYPRVIISWQTAPGTWYCNLYRSVNDTSHFTRIAHVPGRNFEDHGVLGGRTYFYFLKALAWGDSSLIESPRSATVMVTLSPAGGVRGTVQGTIVDDSTSTPIAGVRVRFFRQGYNWTTEYDLTDSLGTYEAMLDTGRYLIKAEPQCEPNSTPQYRPAWFENAPEPSSATIVHVPLGGVFTANFSLRRVAVPRYSSVNGTVFNESGNPIPNATVAVMRSIQDMHRRAAITGTIPGLGSEERQLPAIGYTRGVIWSGATDHQGRFRAVVPQNGSYIAAAGKAGFLMQYCDRTTDPTRASIITAAGDTSGVNFFLRTTPLHPNSINGIIRDTSGGPAPSRVILFPRPPQGQPPTQVVHSGAGGQYTFLNVPPGTYTVLAVPFSNYGSAFYKEGQYGVAQWQLADSTVVGPSSTANVGVLPIASSGVVTASGVALSVTGEPLTGGRVLVRDASGTLVGTTLSTSTGSFAVDALPHGDVTFLVDREPFNPQVLSITIPQNTYVVSNLNIILTRAYATGAELSGGTPFEFSLEQNRPNPFNPSTVIRYALPTTVPVSLRVFDLLGREVALLVNEEQKAGSYTVVFNANNLASGVYYYRLQAGEYGQGRKMLLLR